MNISHAIDYRRLFKAMPGKVLVLKPLTYEIVAATDAYLSATMTDEESIRGRCLFDVFPDDPGEVWADGVANLRRSMSRVEALRGPDVMGVQRYPVPLPGGGFEERYWSPVNTPLLNEHGEVELILHRVEDVTDVVQQTGMGTNDEQASAARDILNQTAALRDTVTKLDEYERRMRTAERLLHVGAWEFHIETGRLYWSDRVFDLFGIPVTDDAPDLDGYFALVHPDDRAIAREVYNDFDQQGRDLIEFEHRVVGRDGTVRHIKGVGERHAGERGDVVVGYVQDISSLISTRHRLERAERLLRLAGDKAQLGGWRVELASGETYWTPGTARIHGMPEDYSPPDVDTAIAFYVPDYRTKIEAVFSRCVETGEPYDVICRIQTPEGRQPWVRAIGEAEYDASGNLIAVQGAFQDVSDLKQAEDREASEKQQRLDVLARVSDAFFAVDSHWTVTYANDKAGELLQRPCETLIGVNFWLAFPEAIGTEFQTEYEAALQTGKARYFTTLYAPLERWFDVSAYPGEDGLTVYFRDVTDEQRRLEKLRLVEAAVSRQTDAVVITEADPIDAPTGPRIVYVNDAFERLTGYQRDKILGDTPRRLQGVDTDPEQLARIRQALETRVPVRAELLNYSQSGEQYWLELEISPLFNDKGECTHFVAVQRDIGERRTMEQRLRESQKLEAVGQLTGGVAHDFNNLLTVILSNAEMLTEIVDDDDARAMAELTLSAARRGSELTSRLLAFSRRQPLNPRPTDFNEIIESLRGLARRALHENIELVFLPGDNLGTVEIDAAELDLALLNLIVNARDAMPNGGRLTIETRNTDIDAHQSVLNPGMEPGNYVMMVISDTGVGMSEETRARAFEPFYTTKETGKGSGMGLSMVFGFTKQSGGHINLYSEPGQGTTIKLYFPSVPGARPVHSQPVKVEKPLGGTEHILVAEDDELVLQHLLSQLISLGYRVTTTQSGPEALARLREQPSDVDLLLTDIIMPGGMNGKELAEQAVKECPTLRVLYTSGYTESTIMHHGRLDEGVELLSKPYTRRELACKIRKVLDRR